MLGLFKRISLLALAAGFVSSANASILIEPYLGYHTGKSKQTTTEDFSGMTYGARLGYQQLGFMLGLDYMTGKWTEKGTPNVDLTPSSLGAFVGYNFPVMLRVYGVYGFQNSVKAEAGGTSSKLEGSPALKLGVGFTALPLVSINLEYMTATYDKSDGHTLNPNMTSTAYGLTVSLPFTF